VLLGQQFDQFLLFVVTVKIVIKTSVGMTEQTALDSVLLGEGVKQMQEISREEILRQIFGDIGELADGEEILIAVCVCLRFIKINWFFFTDFTCAVESTVLLHGRMYITNRFICFYSNLFGLEKKIRIPYSHIRSITKENTAMVIPNAIAISTGTQFSYFHELAFSGVLIAITTTYFEQTKRITHFVRSGTVKIASGFSLRFCPSSADWTWSCRHLGRVGHRKECAKAP